MNILNSLIGSGKMNSVQNTQHQPKIPAVVPAANFDPATDAKVLRKAMKGFGTDEKSIINILCHRSNNQRQHIQKVYKTQFGRDLVEDIKSETSGNFENLLVALLIDTWEYRIKIIHDAIEGLGTDEDALIEFLLGYTNHEIKILNQLYYDKYKRTLEDDVVGDTSGHFKRILVSTLVGGREENCPLDYEVARREAGLLLQAGELKIGTDESVFNMVFSRRSYEQIRITDEAYTKITGHSLEKAITSEFSGYIKDALLAILYTARNRPEFFATRLHKSMAGLGTTDKQLIRIIVSRSEIDLINIKNAFQQKYGKSLKSWIKGDTSGDYKTCLLTLIREA